MGAFFLKSIIMQKVLATHLLKHRIKYRKTSNQRVYIIFWVDFKTGEIKDSFTHSNLDRDMFLCNKTNREYVDYEII